MERADVAEALLSTLLSSRLTAGALMLLPALAAAQSLPPPEHRQLAREIFEELIEINTTVRDSGATRAATALAKRLIDGGFPCRGRAPRRTQAPQAESGRPAPRPGQGKPILFLAHLDVVEARREDWSLDPFTLTERDGYFYGRGTMDIKDEAADLVANLLRLKAEGYVPERDIIVALTDDEEGGDDNGVSWLLEHRPELIRAAYVINTDAGGGQMEKGRRCATRCRPARRSTPPISWRSLEPAAIARSAAEGQCHLHAGPGPGPAVRFSFPVRLNATTRGFFRQLATQEKGPVAADLRAVSGDTPDPKAASDLPAVPLYNSSMRTTCVATMLQAGHAENALPQRAQATIQCRLLPGESPEETAEHPGAGGSRYADSRESPGPAGDRTRFAAISRGDDCRGAGHGLHVARCGRSTGDGSLVHRRSPPPPSRCPGLRSIRSLSTTSMTCEPTAGTSGSRVQAFYEGVEFMYRLMKKLTSAPVDAQKTLAPLGLLPR